MCIRDSGNRDHSGWHPREQAARGAHRRGMRVFPAVYGASAHTRPGRRERAAEHMGCLLYTSDAADDLLCVDLGGRRIINKKRLPPYTQQQYFLCRKRSPPCADVTASHTTLSAST